MKRFSINKLNQGDNVKHFKSPTTALVGSLTLLLLLVWGAAVSGQEKQSSKKDKPVSQSSQNAKAKKAAKPNIAQFPDAKVWSDAESASKEFPGFEFIGEFSKGVEARQVTPAAGKFYVSTFQGGLPGAGWDGKRVAHQWVELAALQETLEGWEPVDRGKTVVGKKPPRGAIVLFDGADATAWNNGKPTKDGFLKAGTRTKQKFKDFQLYVEFLVPLKPEPPISHPHRGNSGVFALGVYEIQIADTFGLDLDGQAWQDDTMLKPIDTWCGSIYGIAAPSVNMSLPPLTWQSMEIEFKAARFEDGKKVSSAVISVIHNGVRVHDEVPLPRGTGGGPSGPRDEVAQGPITLQKHSNPNLFRNIWIVPKQEVTK